MKYHIYICCLLAIGCTGKFKSTIELSSVSGQGSPTIGDGSTGEASQQLITLTGVVIESISEDFSAQPNVHYMLETSSGLYSLVPNQVASTMQAIQSSNFAEAISSKVGKTVAVDGYLKQGTLVTTADQIRGIGPTTTQAIGTPGSGAIRKGTRYMLLIPIQFANQTLPRGKNYYQSLLDSGTDSLKTRLATSSGGAVDLAATVIDPVTVSSPIEGCTSPGGATFNNLNKWTNEALSLAITAGAFNSRPRAQWDHIWFVFPYNSGCPFAGLANYKNRYGWLNLQTSDSDASVVGVALHEIGHNFGLAHSGGGHVPPMTFNNASESYIQEYGDESCVMGAGAWIAPRSNFQAQFREFLGFTEESKVARPTTSGTFSLVPTGHQAEGIQLIQIGTYSISLAGTNEEQAAPLRGRLLVHGLRAPPVDSSAYGSLPRPVLLRAALPGEAQSGLAIPNDQEPLFRIRLVGNGAAGAQIVQVEFPGAPIQVADFQLTGPSNFVVGQHGDLKIQSEPVYSNQLPVRLRIDINDQFAFNLNLTPSPESEPGSRTSINQLIRISSLETTPNLKIDVSLIGSNGSVRTKSIQVPNQSPFSDVTLNHWALKYMAAVHAAGIWKGCRDSEAVSNGQYCPDAVVKRAEMAKMIVRARYETLVSPSQQYFDDIPTTHPYFAEIQKMMSCRITSGTRLPLVGALGHFGGTDAITRGQMAVFIVRALEGGSDCSFVPPVNDSNLPANPNDNFTSPASPYFTDVATGDFYFKHVQQMRFYGLTSGCEVTPTGLKYCPGNEITHKEMAVFIARAFLSVP